MSVTKGVLNVNKAEVILAKSERAKKHVLEMIDVRNNRTNS